MKLLIITQKVNQQDSILGFFHRWIVEFSKHVEKLTVICLEEGSHELPTNVRVLSLGKEHGVGKIGRLVRLYRYVWQYRHEYDAVFVHMNPVYVVLCWKLWFVLRKKIFLWYTHKHVDCKLRVASWFVKKIFTASSESLRLRTKTKLVTGHGIDTDFFSPDEHSSRNEKSILSVGRIAPTKQIDVLIHALERMPDMTLDIVGDAVTDVDAAYKKKCEQMVKDKQLTNRVVWHGAVAPAQTRDFYRRAGVFVNVSNTGSLDKVILEALACGTRVVSSNDAARDMPLVSHITVLHTNALVDALTQALRTPASTAGQTYVAENHGLSRCVSLLMKEMQ